MPSLDFHTTTNGTVAVITPTGELDLSGAAVLEVELERLAAEPDLGTVVLDLRRLEFMDSSGLRLVVLADMRARGGPPVRAGEGARDGAPRVRDHADERAAGLRLRPGGCPVRLERRLPVAPEAAAEARHALAEVALPDGRARDVRLLVSELVTNAVRHANLGAGDVILLVVEVADRGVRVEVHDPGGGFVPRAPAPDPTRPSGWGLYLVAELADRWGVDSEERTLVWFELDRSAAAA